MRERTGPLQRIVGRSNADGSFSELDAARAARAAFDATLRFHHPAHSREWNDEGIDDACETVLAMVITALNTKGYGRCPVSSRSTGLTATLEDSAPPVVEVRRGGALKQPADGVIHRRVVNPAEALTDSRER